MCCNSCGCSTCNGNCGCSRRTCHTNDCHDTNILGLIITTSFALVLASALLDRPNADQHQEPYSQSPNQTEQKAA